MAYDSPLPIPPAEMPSIEDTLARLREVYGTAFDDIMTRMLEEVLDPSVKVQVLADAMAFTCFLCAIKAVQARALPPTRENLMGAYWPMQKALKDDVPGMLRQFADAAAQGAI